MERAGKENDRGGGFQRLTHVIDKTTVAHRAEVESPKARPFHWWVGYYQGKKEVPDVGLL